jgi:two-component system, chemotaxis family, chemotaxis protein CheY
MAKAVIVDDSNFMRNIVRSTLEEGGHAILAEGTDGNEAVELYKEYSPDFVTLDITMKGKDGMTAAQEILNADPQAVIFVVSALSKEVLEQKHGIHNVSAYLTKPFEKKDLLDLVSKHVKV